MDKTLGGAGALPTSAEEPETTVREPTSYDSTPELDAAVAGFDLEAWVRGVTNNRRGVTIYADAAGNAEIDLLETREREARLAGAKTAELRKIVLQRREVAQRVASSALDVVFEGRTSDAITRATKEGQAAGLSGNDLMAAIMAPQIVEPAGMTAEMLSTIAKQGPGQFARLLATWKAVTEESGVTIPF
jgi:hypothetical protein